MLNINHLFNSPTDFPTSYFACEYSLSLLQPFHWLKSPTFCSILPRDSQFFQEIHNGLEEMSNIWSIYKLFVVWLLVDYPRSASLRANPLASYLEDSTQISQWQGKNRNCRVSIDWVTRNRCVHVLLSCSTLLQWISLKSVSKIPSSSSAVRISPQGWVWLWKLDYEQGAHS